MPSPGGVFLFFLGEREERKEGPVQGERGVANGRKVAVSAPLLREEKKERINNSSRREGSRSSVRKLRDRVTGKESVARKKNSGEKGDSVSSESP